ncbi:MAG: DegV family protein [Clostridiaceae bacterium]|nr:DegV family protein [Clostridiaceae bacterium]
MRNFVVMTDSCCDMPIEYIKEKNVPYISLTCSYAGNEYNDDFGVSLSYKKFYEDVRHGELPKTSQPNAESYYNVYKKYAEKDMDILYICVSSIFSGAINSANIGKAKILDEFPNANIFIVDALTASLGQGLMLKKAYEMKEAGKNLNEIFNYLEENKMKLNTYISVDDLHHVKRGGRISSSAALIGIVLHIKPIMTVAHDGNLMPIFKIKGRKNALSKLAEIVVDKIEDSENQVIAIGHGDCIEEAEKLKMEIIKSIRVKDVLINPIGPVVGTHGGPGAMAIFFWGKERQ